MIECSMCGAEEMGKPRPAGWYFDPMGGERLCPSCAAATESVGFERPEPGSRERYIERRKTRPWAEHTFWWIVHNAIAHPLIAFVPVKLFFRFHDWTSYKMHGQRGR